MPVSAVTIDELRQKLKTALPDELTTSHVKLWIGFEENSAQLYLVRRKLNTETLVRSLMETLQQQPDERPYSLYDVDGNVLEDSALIDKFDNQTLTLRPKGEMPVLTLKSVGGQNLVVFHLPAIIGRYDRQDPNAGLTIDLTGIDVNRTVSRQHAMISSQDNDLVIENISGKNRIVINDVNILQSGEIHILSDGDRIQMGNGSVVLVVKFN